MAQFEQGEEVIIESDDWMNGLKGKVEKITNENTINLITVKVSCFPNTYRKFIPDELSHLQIFTFYY